MCANYSEESTNQEMVLVPRRPTREMIEAAYWAALDEDAEGVWRHMIEAWLQSKSGNSDSGSG